MCQSPAGAAHTLDSKPRTAAESARACARVPPPPSNARLGGEQTGKEEKRGDRPVQKWPQRNGDVALGQTVDEHNGRNGRAAHGLQVAVFRHDEPSPPQAPVA